MPRAGLSGAGSGGMAGLRPIRSTAMSWPWGKAGRGWDFQLGPGQEAGQCQCQAYPELFRGVPRFPEKRQCMISRVAFRSSEIGRPCGGGSAAQTRAIPATTAMATMLAARGKTTMGSAQHAYVPGCAPISQRACALLVTARSEGHRPEVGAPVLRARSVRWFA